MCTKVHALQIDNKVLIFMMKIDKINTANRSQTLDMKDA
jgi:hypothetical protein